MIQLIYISFSTPSFDPNSDQGIDNILQTANSYNKENSLTGMLIYKGGAFLQLIEGEEEQVQALYGKIAMDTRHENLKVIVKQNTSERLFENWTMAYKKVEDSDLKLMDSVILWKNIIEKNQSGEDIPNDKILEMFKKFRYQL